MMASSTKMVLKKIGIRFKGPALIVIYETPSGKLHQRTMPIRDMSKNSNVRNVAESLRDRHAAIFGSASLVQVEKMLRLAQESMKGKSLDECLEIVAKEFTLNPEEDLNKVDDDTLQRKKDLMNLTFEKNCKKPGDPDFKYDVEEDFDLEGAIETSGWDSEKDDDFGF
ncbi:centrosomal protein of 19 kDa [Ixodes scapularis]|uniref:centrosomal protein of 19 kDa n=1 Tax=Ixodes scapularis TaxID=6945 RepID=UPI0011617368|nr:centrosomal protein of 19 kDa [Ixodes scapularis]